MFNKFPVFRTPASHWLHCSRALSRRSLCKRALAVSLHEKRDLFSCRDAFIDQKTFAILKTSSVWELLSGSPIRRPPQARLPSTYASLCRSTSHLYNKWQGLQIVRRYNRAPHDRRPSSRWYWASGAAHQTTNNVYRIVETSWIGMHRKHIHWIPNLANW